MKKEKIIFPVLTLIMYLWYFQISFYTIVPVESGTRITRIIRLCEFVVLLVLQIANTILQVRYSQNKIFVKLLNALVNCVLLIIGTVLVLFIILLMPAEH